MTSDIDSLTESEKEVLRLYLTTSDPKRIAVAIERSPHEVERRFKSARRRLAVSRTRDAATLLAVHEGNPAYQEAVYQDLVRGQDASFDLIRPDAEAKRWSNRLALLPTRERPWNASSAWSRLLAIVGLAGLMIATAVLVISFGEALSKVARHLKWTERPTQNGLFSKINKPGTFDRPHPSAAP